jgi:hypothetical protein
VRFPAPAVLILCCCLSIETGADGITFPAAILLTCHLHFRQLSRRRVDDFKTILDFTVSIQAVLLLMVSAAEGAKDGRNSLTKPLLSKELGLILNMKT